MDMQKKLKQEMKMNKMIDKTIETVCKKIQTGDVFPESYADMVKALAELIRVRRHK